MKDSIRPAHLQEDVARLFRLFSRLLPEGLPPMAKLFREHLQVR